LDWESAQRVLSQQTVWRSSPIRLEGKGVVKSKATKIKTEEKGLTTKESLETSKQTQATSASYSADRLLNCDVFVRC
jgi:hypothetical protein